MKHIRISGSDTFSQLGVSSKNISRLSSVDATLFREAFKQEPTYYCNSWLYILRSTRDDQGSFGHKFIGKDVLIGIGYRHHTVYLIHPMGNARFATTLALCKKILRNMHCSIVLKKLDQELYKYLVSNKLFQQEKDASLLYAETFPKYPSEIMSLEEETFPEHTLHLSALFNPDTGAYKQSDSFMRKVKRFEKNMITLLPRSNMINVESTSGFLALFTSHPEKYNSYIQMIREVNAYSKEDTTYKICAYYDQHETIHGLYISESLGNGNMGLYCAVSSRDFPGITEWMDYDFFQQLYQDKVHYLYLGGSETSGVDTYIKKLFPITPPYFLQPMRVDNDGTYSSDTHISSAD